MIKLTNEVLRCFRRWPTARAPCARMGALVDNPQGGQPRRAARCAPMPSAARRSSRSNARARTPTLAYARATRTSRCHRARAAEWRGGGEADAAARRRLAAPAARARRHARGAAVAAARRRGPARGRRRVARRPRPAAGARVEVIEARAATGPLGCSTDASRASAELRDQYMRCLVTKCRRQTSASRGGDGDAPRRCRDSNVASGRCGSGATCRIASRTFVHAGAPRRRRRQCLTRTR